MTQQRRHARAAEDIANALTGRTWSPDTLNEIAGILRRAGFTIAEPIDEDARERLIEAAAEAQDTTDDLDDLEAFAARFRQCPACGGDGNALGQLGRRLHFRCRQCGIDFSREVPR